VEKSRTRQIPASCDAARPGLRWLLVWLIVLAICASFHARCQVCTCEDCDYFSLVSFTEDLDSEEFHFCRALPSQVSAVILLYC
jgi:hypothetical protein